MPNPLTGLTRKPAVEGLLQGIGFAVGAALVGVVLSGVGLMATLLFHLSAPWLEGTIVGLATSLFILLLALLLASLSKRAKESKASAPASNLPVRASIGKQSALTIKAQETFLNPRVPESDTSITYKAKLGIGFVNLSDRAIHFLAPSWRSQSGDVGVQAPFWCRYQRPVEGRWKKAWQNESADVTVEPNGRFRIMLGLDKACPHDELEMRRRSGTLGTLLIPIEIGGERSAFEYRVKEDETDLTPITERV